MLCPVPVWQSPGAEGTCCVPAAGLEQGARARLSTKPCPRALLLVHLGVKLVMAKKHLTQVLANDYPIKESADIISFSGFINLSDNKTDGA